MELSGSKRESRLKVKQFIHERVRIIKFDKISQRRLRINLHLTEIKVLINENKFKGRIDLFEHINNVEDLHIFVHHIVDPRRHFLHHAFDQRLYQDIHMHKCPELFPVAMDSRMDSTFLGSANPSSS